MAVTVTLPTASDIEVLVAARGVATLRPSVRDIAFRLLANTALKDVAADAVFISGEPTLYAVRVDTGHGRSFWQGVGSVQAAKAYVTGEVVRRVV